ncbi:TatD family hydrolase [Eubacteriales bacterium OttesenSCG-928-G02]|nr:TatD family hydrolase [Eubacteriales bacterium OttesenSCG-928-G02]
MFDTHAHYDDEKYAGETDLIIANAFKSGVKYIINAGISKETSLFGKNLSESYQGIYFSAGVHPHEAQKYDENLNEWLEPLLMHPKCVAVGEIGLDYHYDFSPRNIQAEIFKYQLEIALKYNKPVIIHDREAHKDCIDTVLSYKDLKGVFHSFSGSAETAKLLQQQGWYLSFNGIVTFKNAENPRKALLAVDDDKLLIETDCPYLTPHPFRGKRNDSSYLEHIVSAIAEIRGESVEHIIKITTQNAKNLFKL